MPTLTLMPAGEAAGTQSQFTANCPNWILVVVHDQEIVIESWCGRYFEWLDNQGDDVTEMLNDIDCSQLLDGLYVVEGHVVTHSASENEGRETEWHFDQIRSLQHQEWQRYREGAEVWEPTHFDPAFVEIVIDEATSELQRLLEAGKGWLEWRKNIGIDLNHAEIELVAAIYALTDESDGLPHVSG